MRLFAALLISIFGFSVPLVAAAQTRPVVVELFTSQGCSSCPPADAMLHELAKQEDVIALALHVDYWDYIGWKDSFADPAFTKRQRAYARVQGERMVYTPQMMINGRQHVVGNHRGKVNKALQAHAAQPVVLDISASRQGRSVTIQLGQSSAPAEYVVHLVAFLPKAKVAIERGENAGKTLTYANVVTKWRSLERWNGRKAREMKTQINSDDQLVVLVQKRNFGEIVAAARVR